MTSRRVSDLELDAIPSVRRARKVFRKPWDEIIAEKPAAVSEIRFDFPVNLVKEIIATVLCTKTVQTFEIALVARRTFYRSDDHCRIGFHVRFLLLFIYLFIFYFDLNRVRICIILAMVVREFSHSTTCNSGCRDPRKLDYESYRVCSRIMTVRPIGWYSFWTVLRTSQR